MKLQDMTKEEILEAVDLMNTWEPIPVEELPVDRGCCASGDIGDLLWERIIKYRQPLIDYIFRDVPVDDSREKVDP